MPSPKIDFSHTKKVKLLKSNPCCDIQKDGNVLKVPSPLKAVQYQELVIYMRGRLWLIPLLFSAFPAMNRELRRARILLNSLLPTLKLHSSAGFYKTDETGLSLWQAVIMLYQLLIILEDINVVSSSQSGVCHGWWIAWACFQLAVRAGLKKRAVAAGPKSSWVVS